MTLQINVAMHGEMFAFGCAFHHHTNIFAMTLIRRLYDLDLNDVGSKTLATVSQRKVRKSVLK